VFNVACDAQLAHRQHTHTDANDFSPITATDKAGPEQELLTIGGAQEDAGGEGELEAPHGQVREWLSWMRWYAFMYALVQGFFWRDMHKRLCRGYSCVEHLATPPLHPRAPRAAGRVRWRCG
jgi:hypothetical protein